MHWTWTNCVFTALGVLMLYSRWGKNGLKLYIPRDIIRTLHLSEDHTCQVELLVFITVGTLVAMACVEPDTVRQSFAAGLGWTGLLATPNTSKK
jgi:hypothetical protein